MSIKAVEVRDLTFAYPGREAVLRDISFSVDTGETFGIIGPNGAGKSTLLLHFNGIFRGSGRVFIFGEEVSRKNLKRIRRSVGIVFQDPNDQLFMPTVFDDIAFGPLNLNFNRREIESRVKTAIEQVGLDESCLDQSPAHLSLGEKKRISLATVLVMDPDILVLDEPTSNLDPGGRRTFIHILNGINKTKILATHDLDFVWEVCSKVMVLDGGRIIAEGMTESILRDKEMLEKHSLEIPLSAFLETGRSG